MAEVDSGPHLETFPREKWAGPSLEEIPLGGDPWERQSRDPLEEKERGLHLGMFPLWGLWIPLQEIPTSGIPYLERWPKIPPLERWKGVPIWGCPWGGR